MGMDYGWIDGYRRCRTFFSGWFEMTFAEFAF